MSMVEEDKLLDFFDEPLQGSEIWASPSIFRRQIFWSSPLLKTLLKFCRKSLRSWTTPCPLPRLSLSPPLCMMSMVLSIPIHPAAHLLRTCLQSFLLPRIWILSLTKSGKRIHPHSLMINPLVQPTQRFP
jgi:hypothetical protein